MPKPYPHARGQLTSTTARDTAHRVKAEQLYQELDDEKQALDERTAQLRAKRLAREPSMP